MHQVKPKKSLGQHFLTDMNIAKKITSSLSGTGYVALIEIGPGTGVLTQYLLNSSCPFYAYEIDKESIAFLKKNFQSDDFIIEGNFLKQDLTSLPQPFAIIGNFPYNISSQIFFKILENRNSISEVVCMVQKEVAERIASPHGNKTYGILSVFLQTFFDISYMFTVHEHCFRPSPKVKSAVIRLKRNERKSIDCDPKLFFRIVKQSFNQRRKTLRNSLKNICLNLRENDKFGNKRPEQLNVEEFIELTRVIESCLSNKNKE